MQTWFCVWQTPVRNTGQVHPVDRPVQWQEGGASWDLTQSGDAPLPCLHPLHPQPGTAARNEGLCGSGLVEVWGVCVCICCWLAEEYWCGLCVCVSVCVCARACMYV